MGFTVTQEKIQMGIGTILTIVSFGLTATSIMLHLSGK